MMGLPGIFKDGRAEYRLQHRPANDIENFAASAILEC